MLDAGGTNSDSSNQQFGERHWTLKNAAGYNWGYKTVPQENLAEREIDCSRGKGLGGSTAINFCVWTRGSKDDYERWAELTGCDDWKWENVLERFKKVRDLFLQRLMWELKGQKVKRELKDFFPRLNASTDLEKNTPHSST